MSGHSKWANIKKQKGINDKQKGVMFSKLSRLITLIVVESGGITDPENNVRLRLIIEKAKQYNMPKENIERAINNAANPDKSQIKEVVYEGFGPGGVALMINATTDNSNRTLSEIRNVLHMNGGKLGSQGSVNYLFQKCGLVTFNKNFVTEEKILLFADKIGALDIDQDDTTYFVFIPFSNLGKIKDLAQDLKYTSAEIDYKPNTLISIDEETFIKLITLIELLEEMDDVHNVYSNFEHI